MAKTTKLTLHPKFTIGEISPRLYGAFLELNGMIEDFIHAGDIGTGADDRRQILQRPLQRVVEP